MRRQFGTVVSGLLLSIFLLGCEGTPAPSAAPTPAEPSASTTIVGSAGTPAPGASAAPLASARPANTLPAAVTPRGSAALPYADDFSNPNSGWPVGTFNRDLVEYRAGMYHIQIGQENYLRAAWLTDFALGAVSVEADATISGVPDDGMLGVVCRVDTARNSYYGFMIGADKRYTLVKVVEGKTSTLSEYYLQPNTIRGPGDANHLRADCVGDTLTFIVNDQKLVENHDGDLPSGSFGMIASTGPSGKSAVDATFTQISARPAPTAATALPTAAATAAPAFNAVAWRDNFTNANSGWPLRDDQDVKSEYTNNTYHVVMQKDNTSVLLRPKQAPNTADVSVEVVVDSTSGPIEDSFGVACRIKDELNYYRLVIGADGFFGIAKVRAGQNIWLAFHESLVAPINARKSPGDASKSNSIRGDCIGNRLSLYANGRKLDDVEDDEFKAGDVGLRVGTEKGGAAVVFKDFVVRTP